MSEPETLDPGTVIDAVARLRGKITSRVQDVQGDVPTFFDNYLLLSLEGIEKQAATASTEHWLTAARQMLERFTDVLDGERFVPWARRNAETSTWQRLPWEPARVQMCASQGVARCLTWRDRPLFKSAFDFAIYPMLIGELRPATILELGSGTGASAVWFSDVLRIFGMKGHVFSIDLVPPTVEYPGVTFVEGDVNDIERLLVESGVERMPHPWLIIEDAHVNTIGVMRAFAGLMKTGDYLVIEDSFSKQADVARFDAEEGEHFRVDARYTDYFGRNTASAADSLFVRV